MQSDARRDQDTGSAGAFDRFADAVGRVTGEAYFFAACVLVVVLWVPSYFLFGTVNTWQLLINTLTTIVTFLLVALLQNTQRRAEIALQRKLDALADALADLMAHVAGDDEVLKADIEDLKNAVGLEQRVST